MSAVGRGLRQFRGRCAAAQARHLALGMGLGMGLFAAAAAVSATATAAPPPGVTASAPHHAVKVAPPPGPVIPAPLAKPAAPRPAAGKPAPAVAVKPAPAAAVKPTPTVAIKQSAAAAVKPALAASSAASNAATTGKHGAVGTAATATAAIAATASASAPAAAGFAIIPVPADPCELLAKRMPNLSPALCAAAALQATGARSVNGFPIYQRDVSARFQEVAAPDAPKPLRRPRVLVIGGIHGDELSSTSLVFHWVAHALETGGDMDWRFLPATNPDGLLQARPTRTNARGVDLNRNFPTPRWAQEAPDYWAKRTKKDPRRFPGLTPLSEPETRFLNETMDRWKPDLIVSVHAPYGVLDYDGPSIPPERLGRLFLDRVGIFPGSLGHYGGVHRGVPVVTIELPSAIRTPTNAEMRQMWIDLLRWIGERVSVPAER